MDISNDYMKPWALIGLGLFAFKGTVSLTRYNNKNVQIKEIEWLIVS